MRQADPRAGALTREDEIEWLREQRVEAEWQAERGWALGALFGPVDAVVSLLLPATMETADVRWLDVQHGSSAMDSFFDEFRRRSFRTYGGLPQSELVTVGVELGLEDVDQHRMWRRQKKVMVDALRRAYRNQVGIPTFHFDEVLEMASGRGLLSLALIPAVVGGYAYHQGIDRSVEAAGLRFSIDVKKLRRVFDYDGGDEPLMVGSLHVRPGRFFFGIVATLEREGDGYQSGFIGISTDASIVIEAIEGFRGPEKE